MPTIVMQAESTSLVLNGTPLTDFAEGDYLELTIPNPLTSRINSASGGVNITERVDAGVGDLVFRVQKYSASDVFLNNARNQREIVVLNGSVKEDYLRDGTQATESIILENGTITTQPTNTKNNTDGNGMMEYTVQFRNVIRNI